MNRDEAIDVLLNFVSGAIGESATSQAEEDSMLAEAREALNALGVTDAEIDDGR